MDNVVKGAISISILARQAALNEFQRKLEAGKKQEGLLSEDLLTAAPDEWRAYLLIRSTIPGLLLFGCTQDRVKFRECFGFTNKDDVTKKVAALNKAWADVVIVSVNFETDHFELQFAAVSLKI